MHITYRFGKRCNIFAAACATVRCREQEGDHLPLAELSCKTKTSGTSEYWVSELPGRLLRCSPHLLDDFEELEPHGPWWSGPALPSVAGGKGAAW